MSGYILFDGKVVMQKVGGLKALLIVLIVAVYRIEEIRLFVITATSILLILRSFALAKAVIT